MEQPKSAETEKKPTLLGWPFLNNWAFLRKIETLIFAFLIVALPFFAFKVLDITTATLVVKNTTVDLVDNLRHLKQVSLHDQTTVRLFSRNGDLFKPFKYTVEQGGRPVETKTLPLGVSIVGSVTFKPDGLPNSPASFIISKGARTAHVEVDAQGFITSP